MIIWLSEILALVRVQEIKITKIDSTPGILSFKIGENYIVSSKHIFLYDVDLNIFEDEIAKLVNSYEKVNSSSILKAESILSHNLRNIYQHLQSPILEIKTKFQNVKN